MVGELVRNHVILVVFHQVAIAFMLCESLLISIKWGRPRVKKTIINLSDQFTGDSSTWQLLPHL
jgi:hypothetical protein